MTWIQQVCWRLEMDYLGHPYYVSGNAIYHALKQVLPADQRTRIHASHGMFAPGQFGAFPEWHSLSGSRPALGATLPEVTTYDDLWLHRHPEQPWVLDSRPRDAVNTHDIRTQSGQPAFAHEMVFGRSAESRKTTWTTSWFVHAYLHADDPDVLPIEEEALDGLQFGGQRNYGYGTTRLKATQMVDLDALGYGRLRGADAYRLELVTPFVLRSDYPGTNDVDIPWWWTVETTHLRQREEEIVEGPETYHCGTVDHGQVVRYGGDRPVVTAKNAIRRVGAHSKYGFGEIRVCPIESE
ncbi:hypothetical protein GCM10009037_19670 [Halarchaeum grantii]|uniref:Uncharacterized protein n=1 Tax=Halarchaeum grantii TaxID=1193105 RepID=A0A830F3M2_9EURY|nr:hypothetical protein GCM10009037_19670 [Halarchaeum grantii]